MRFDILFCLFLFCRVCQVVGDVLFSTKSSSPFDLAFVELKVPVPEAALPRMSQSFIPGWNQILSPAPHQAAGRYILVVRLSPGTAVVVVGYGGLGQNCGPSLTCGVVSKSISLNHQPVMLQTTCAVQAGASGGAVVHKHSGELLGKESYKTSL